MDQNGIKIDDKHIKAIIYDTSGQERFRSIPKGYIRKGDGIIIVYDITDRSSFESMEYWINEVAVLRSDHPPVIILGNKWDLEEHRQVKYSEGQNIAEKYGAFFEETTIRKPDSIEHAFQIIIKTVYIHHVENPKRSMKKNKKDHMKTLYHGHYANNIKEVPTWGSKKWDC